MSTTSETLPMETNPKGTIAPESKEPKAKEPQAKEPEAKEPQAKEPEAKEPEAKEPKAKISKPKETEATGSTTAKGTKKRKAKEVNTGENGTKDPEKNSEEEDTKKAKKAKKPRRKSGFDLFRRHFFEMNKCEGEGAFQKINKMCSERWKELEENGQQKEWNDKAKEINEAFEATLPKVAPTIKRAPSAWINFLSNYRKTHKESMKETGELFTNAETFKTAGKVWKSLTKAEQDTWKSPESEGSSQMALETTEA
jgi:hypothetical protein